MNKTDQGINVIIIVVIIIYLAVLIIEIITNRFPYLTNFLNLVTASYILIYWIQKQLSITQHIFESREIIVLCFEIAVVGVAIYAIMNSQWSGWVKIIQYIIFGIHFLALTTFFIFMLTFKMKKLI